jgi:hypothetical protein
MLYMLETVKGGHCLLEVVEVLLCMLEAVEGGICLLEMRFAACSVDIDQDWICSIPCR